MLKNREQVQQDAMIAIFNKFRVGIGVSVGLGKTLIGISHMHYLYEKSGKSKLVKFLVVGPKKSIFTTWKEECKKFNVEFLLEYITFSTYLSLKKQSVQYDCVYLDEMHSLLPSNEEFLTMYKGMILGLSGTPPRFKNSEKGLLVEKYCPVEYTYYLDEAVDNNILNDYSIIVHKLPLNTNRTLKIKKKSGGYFVTSELDSYNYWCEQIGTAENAAKEETSRLMRMRSMMDFTTKERYAKYLMNMINDKCIIFCNTQNQADRICDYSYHSKNTNSEINLELFNNNSIQFLSCVEQLSEGKNIQNLKVAIILHSFSNERKAHQKIGRLERLPTNEKATIHILAYENTVDMYWVEKALQDFNQNKIIYTEPL